MSRNRALIFCTTVVSLALLFPCQTRAAPPRERDKTTPQEVFDAMRDGFVAEKARGVRAHYQFLISGPRGGEWWILVDDGKFNIGRGKIQNADVTLVASDSDWIALANDKLSGVWATLTGRLKVRGDQMLARKLDEMFP